MLDSHESPTIESGSCIIVLAHCSQDTLYAVWAEELHFHITSLRMGNPDSNGQVFELFEVMLKQHIICESEYAINPAWGDGHTSGHGAFRV